MSLTRHEEMLILAKRPARYDSLLGGVGVSDLLAPRPEGFLWDWELLCSPIALRVKEGSMESSRVSRVGLRRVFEGFSVGISRAYTLSLMCCWSDPKGWSSW